MDCPLGAPPFFLKKKWQMCSFVGPMLVKSDKVPSMVAQCARKPRECPSSGENLRNYPLEYPSSGEIVMQCKKCNAVPYKLPYMQEKGLELFHHKCTTTFCMLVLHHMQLVPCLFKPAGQEGPCCRQDGTQQRQWPSGSSSGFSLDNACVRGGGTKRQFYYLKAGYKTAITCHSFL